MVTCGQCGTVNQPGVSFCEQCGEYLEWEEQSAKAEVTSSGPEPELEPEPEEAAPAPARRSVMERVMGLAGDIASPLDRGAAPVPDEPSPGLHEQAPTPSTHSGGAPSPSVSTTQGPTAPVRPGAASVRARRRDLPAEDRRPLPGESVCPECGAGNVATRKFCRRCGADLADAPKVAVPPWYRRIMRRSPRPGPLAGSRPKVRSGGQGRRRAFRLAAILTALLAVAWFARPYVAGTVNLVRDRISNEIVRPSGLTASGSAEGHPATAVADGAPNQYWSPAVSGGAKGQYVTLRMAGPVRLAYIKVYNGPSSQPGKDYQATARVDTLELTMTQRGGAVQTRSITLKDAPGEQNFHVGVSDVVSVRLTIASAFGARADRRVALGEVELFKRS